jgi:hypothetical protein
MTVIRFPGARNVPPKVAVDLLDELTTVEIETWWATCPEPVQRRFLDRYPTLKHRFHRHNLHAVVT